MPTARRRLAAPIAAFAAAFTTTLAAGCATHHPVAVVQQQPAAVSYAPAAYGVQVGNAFDCYYVDDVTEVTNMVAAGLCPANSIPTLMPLTWHETYAYYYDSPGYYNTYIPVARRSTYINVTVVNFNKQYGSQIKTASANATYKGSNGTTVRGSGLGSGTTFGGGNNRVAPTLGGGNNRNPAPAPSAPKAPAGGFGGGNARPNPAPKPAPVVPR